MVYFIVASIIGEAEASRMGIYAFLIALVVEFSRLLRTPWLDAFRLTTAGALLLGRVFSPWNIVAYGTGIALGLALDARLVRHSRSC